MTLTYWICVPDLDGVVHAFELGQWRTGMSASYARTECEKLGFARRVIVPRGADRVPREALSCAVCLLSPLTRREDVIFSETL